MGNITKEGNRYISNRDRVRGFIYVVLIFSVCTSACLWALTHGTSLELFGYKDTIIKKTQRQKGFQVVQQDYIRSCDSLFRRIEEFNPGVNASYEESDIKFLINDMRSVYERNSLDERYKVFLHVSLFYDMWFSDKKKLWSKKENVRQFERNLQECEIGLQKREDELKNRQKR